MSILIDKPGILTTVQDLGHTGYRAFGIGPGGAMDRIAVRLTNTLVGNEERDATLEMHFPAAEILFDLPSTFAVGGADLSPELDGQAIDNWSVYYAERGSRLRFAAKRSGNRAYLAVGGGLETDKWLGSSSTNLTACRGGIDGRKIEIGDRIHLGQFLDNIQPGGAISPSLIPHYRSFPTIRITRGAEYDLLENESRATLESGAFKISNESNRMGFRLTGQALTLSLPSEMLSSAVCFGTIQLMPDGQMIVLMADHQTTGGYPRIAHVIEHDLPVIAQLGSGDKVAFHLVTNKDSEALNAQFEREMAFFRAGCGMRKVGRQRLPKIRQ
ncbi:MAG: biotin-dependent carboxyltransferase family protein [Acidobacteriota bacterium]